MSPQQESLSVNASSRLLEVVVKLSNGNEPINSQLLFDNKIKEATKSNL